MAAIDTDILIDADPATVWSVVEPIETHVEWMHDAVAIRFVSPQHRGVGTRFECDTKVGPFSLVDVMEITEWKPQEVMGVSHRGIVAGDGRFTLEPAATGTRFRWREQLRFPWYLGGPLTAWAATPVLKWIWTRNLRSLKARVESGQYQAG